MAKTYEIPTTTGTKTVQADTKQAALTSIGATPSPISATTKATAPYVVPPPPVTGAAAGITGGADASIESYNTLASQIQADKAAKQKASDESFGRYEESVNKVLGIQGSRQQVEDSLHVDELGKLNNDAFTALQASKRAQQVEVQQALDAAGGLKQGAAEATQMINRRYAFEQADLSIALDVSNRNYLAAQATADKKIAMQLEPLQTLLNFQKSFYEANRADLSEAEDRELQLLITDNQRKYEETKTQAETLQKTKLALMQMAQENRAPAAIINAIQTAQTPEAAITAAREYGTDMLGREAQLAQIRASNASTARSNAEIQALVEASKPIVVTPDPARPGVESNLETLQAIFASSKVSAANRTAIGNALALARAASDLADANPGGKFEGLNPLRGVADFVFPSFMKSEKTVKNDALISALNLQTQFWASGAALTEAQTKEVMKMIPNKTDSDKQAKTKTNNLVNYMLSQTSSRLLTDGITYKPAAVNLFETTDLLGQASPAQIAELRAAGLIK